MEIEKKFAVEKMPQNLEKYEKEKIEQGYLCIKPTVRIRKSNDEYTLNYKWKQKGVDEKDAIQNIEYTMPLSEENYNLLLGKIENYLIKKDRYIIPIGDGLNVELDVFHGNLEGLVFAEVEFPNIEAAKKFVKPQWLGRNLCFDKRFDNTVLSRVERYTREYDPSFAPKVNYDKFKKI